MTVIALLSASFCHGDEIAAQVSERMGWPLKTDEALVDLAAERHGASRAKLGRAIWGAPSVFERITRERELQLALLRDAMAALLDGDPLVYHGHGTLLVPEAVRHVLRVCLVAQPRTRLENGTRGGERSRAEIDKAIAADDEALARWSSHWVGLGPWTASLYDVFVPLDDTRPEQAVEMICTQGVNPAVQNTRRSRKALADFQLQARVLAALGAKGLEVDAAADDGVVTLTINRYVMRLQHLEEQLGKLAGAVPGVRRVETRVGPHFHQPNIYGELDVEVPRKILLVDDEVEFVQTLSERLQTRNLESAVAYDGEQALAIAAEDTPDVMVLDMKMPGLDGMRVLREVKRKHPRTEVIVLTAHGSDREKEQALAQGAFAYLRKPADIDDLARLMKDAYAKVQAGDGAGSERAPQRAPRDEED